MSGEIQAHGDEQPRASTSRDSAEPRVSTTTTTFHDSLLPEDLPAPTSVDDNSNILMGSASSLGKLQTYLPTGSWVMYTALQTWAFSLRPGDPPTSPTSNCNSHQRIALIIVVCHSALLAFLSSFVKHFVYDTDGLHVLYPSPNLFNVACFFTDPVTAVKFPCRTKEKRYCWPLVNNSGEVRYDEKGGRIRVMVFKPNITIHVNRKVWIKRVWDSWLTPEEPVPEAPRVMSTSASSKHMSSLSTVSRLDGKNVTYAIDDVFATAPPLQPRRTKTIVGAFGSKAYLDLRPCVWAHALVSVLAFATLALFSTQVSGCIYPSIPDYLPPTVQTAMLILLSLVAALFIQDDAVSLGQKMPRPVAVSGQGEEQEVPAYLKPVVDMLVWIPRQDVFKSGK